MTLDEIDQLRSRIEAIAEDLGSLAGRLDDISAELDLHASLASPVTYPMSHLAHLSIELIQVLSDLLELRGWCGHLLPDTAAHERATAWAGVDESLVPENLDSGLCRHGSYRDPFARFRMDCSLSPGSRAPEAISFPQCVGDLLRCRPRVVHIRGHSLKPTGKALGHPGDLTQDLYDVL